MWEPGQLIDELAATRHAFGYMGLTGPTPAAQPNQPPLAGPVSTAYNEDMIPDLTTRKPPPRTVPYQPPSFNLDRPTRCLMKEERIEVHHNYISAVSGLSHKKDLINRLKQSELHNIPNYEVEMTHHMALHTDVLGRIHTILKQDDYFRTLRELPVIDGLHTYNDIQLFPELFDTAAVIERVTSEADAIEKQLNRSGMYPFPQTPLPCTSGFIPRPSSPSPVTGEVAAKPVHKQQGKETSTGSSLPCGQETQTAPTNSQIPAPPGNNTTPQGTSLNNLQVHMQLQNVATQQQSLLSQPQFPNPNAIPAQPQFTHPHVTPQASPIRQHSPIRTQADPFSQHSIPAPEATESSTPE